MTTPLATTERTRRILVADDDDDIRTFVVLLLESAGYNVASCADGETARDMARACHPDLIVMDVMMPQRDGLDVLASLKANPATRAIPVVLVSARVSDAAVWEGWQAGADYYMTKPFDPDELLRFVDHHVGSTIAGGDHHGRKDGERMAAGRHLGLRGGGDGAGLADL